MQAPFGALGPELRYRTSQAMTAFHEARRRIYKNRDVPVAKKAILLEATVVSKLTLGAGSWPPLSKRDQKIFDATVWKLYRSVLCIPRTGNQSVTAFQCLACVGLPSPSTLLKRLRLSYLRQLITSAPAALWAVVRADRPYADLLAADLRWLFSWTHATSALPNPAEGWAEWSRFMRDQPGAFKGLVRRAVALDHQRVKVIAALDDLHRYVLTLTGSTVRAPPTAREPFTEMCLPCKRAFGSRVAWAGHSARMHGYRSTAFLTASGNVCRTCGLCFGSVGRLRRHLTSVPACLAGWGAFSPDGALPDNEIHVQAPPFSVSRGLAMHRRPH